MYVYVYHDNDNKVTILSQIDLKRVGGGGGGGGAAGRQEGLWGYQVPDACSLFVEAPLPSWRKCVEVFVSQQEYWRTRGTVIN